MTRKCHLNKGNIDMDINNYVELSANIEFTTLKNVKIIGLSNINNEL